MVPQITDFHLSESEFYSVSKCTSTFIHSAYIWWHWELNMGALHTELYNRPPTFVFLVVTQVLLGFPGWPCSFYPPSSIFLVVGNTGCASLACPFLGCLVDIVAYFSRMPWMELQVPGPPDSLLHTDVTSFAHVLSNESAAAYGIFMQK